MDLPKGANGRFVLPSSPIVLLTHSTGTRDEEVFKLRQITTHLAAPMNEPESCRLKLTCLSWVLCVGSPRAKAKAKVLVRWYLTYKV